MPSNVQTDRFSESTERDVLESLSSEVDIIVPVFRGIKETQRCLESLLISAQQTPCELIVINDHSPEPEINEYLIHLQRTHSFTLLYHSENLGFVESVNEGIALHPQRDVVLLNSDTQVHGDWLDRLRRCAYSDPNIGTVTPFSNNATLCSYPRFLEDNPLPTGWSAATLDALFAETNAGRSCPIPTAVGFCMYIKRRCLLQTGNFNAALFKRGYGEENEFSLRAAQAGFQHRLCGDVFVYHKGGVSFSESSAASKAAALLIMRERYPSYETQLRMHFAQDPARALRRRIDLARLARSQRHKLLLITHAMGGGTEKHVQDLARLLAETCEVLILRVLQPDRISLTWAPVEEEFTIALAIPEDYSKLVDFLKALPIVRMHFHHFIKLSAPLLQLPKALNVPYDITVHDYYAICPQYTLTRRDGRYCTEPDSAGCNACLAERPAPGGLDISAWRNQFAELFRGAERVLAPSWDILGRFKRYMPEANYCYLPHPEAQTSAVQPEFKVLVLGMLSPAKGAGLLEACALDARNRQLPLFFRVIGWPQVSTRKEPDIPLSFFGPYADTELPTLIARERADLIFFPALWPETYSYTLSAAMRSGLPILAPRIGAFSERLKGYRAARLLEWDSPASAWNAALLALLGVAQREAAR